MHTQTLYNFDVLSFVPTKYFMSQSETPEILGQSLCARITNYIKGIFAALVQLFKRIFGCSDEESYALIRDNNELLGKIKKQEMQIESLKERITILTSEPSMPSTAKAAIDLALIPFRIMLFPVDFFLETPIPWTKIRNEIYQIW